jgi:hypothetical protein
MNRYLEIVSAPCPAGAPTLPLLHKTIEQPAPRGSLMTHFSVGDRVSIRFGKQQGQSGTIIKSQAADAYIVKIEDGSVLFFSGKGLEKRAAGNQEVR